MVRLLLPASALAALVSAALAAPAVATPACNASAAAQLEQRLPVKPYKVKDRLGQKTCFDFSGDGRKDIVFSGWEFMNHGAHYWAAFRATRTGWVRVMFRRGCCGANPKTGSGISIRRAGRRILVTEPVYGPADPACCPSGGSQTGTWAWSAGALKLLAVRKS